MNKKNIINKMVIAIILFIMLFFLIKEVAIIEKKIPTGYVDIFDINGLEKENSELKNDLKNKLNNESNMQLNKENNYQYNIQYSNVKFFENKNTKEDENNITKEESIITIDEIEFDEKKEYTSTMPLNIFKHKSYYVKNDKIAPGIENSYKFIVRNNNNFAIIYKLEIEEDNQYNIDMRYKLKVNEKYMTGSKTNWSKAKDLLHEGVVLEANSKNEYVLDWKWFEENNYEDTKIGTNVDANYKLNIKFWVNTYE